MNRYLFYLAAAARVVITVVVAFTGGATAHAIDFKKVETPASAANTQPVDSCQGGARKARINPEKNFADLSNTLADSRPVMLAGNNPARRSHEMRASTNMPIINGVDKQD